MTGRVFPLMPGSKLALKHAAQMRPYLIETEADKKARIALPRTDNSKPLKKSRSADQARQLITAFKE